MNKDGVYSNSSDLYVETRLCDELDWTVTVRWLSVVNQFVDMLL